MARGHLQSWRKIRPKDLVRWKGRVGGALVVLLLLLMLPAIVTRTPLVNRIVANLLPAQAGSLSVERVSLGWFAETRLEQVTLQSPKGTPLLEVPHAVVSRGLIGWLTNRQELGQIVVARPVVHIVPSAQSSNWEDFVNALGENDSESTEVSLQLQVADGKIVFHPESTGRDEVLPCDYLKLAIDHGELTSLEIRSQGSPPNQLGERSLFAQTRLEATYQPGSPWQMELASWPISVATPWLRRVLKGADSQGQLDASFRVETVAREVATESPVRHAALEHAARQEFRGELTVTNLRFRATALGEDELAQEKVTIPFAGTINDSAVALEQFDLRSSLADLSVRGKWLVDLAERPSPVVEGSVWSQLPQEIQGRVDLAELVRQLPHATRLRAETQLQQGEVSFSVQQTLEQAASKVTAQFAVGDISGTLSGQPFRWDQPVNISATIQKEESWSIESLIAQADFAEVTAKGDLSNIDAHAEFDLAQLRDPLEKIFDWPEFDLSGQGTATIQAQAASAGEIVVVADADLRDLKLMFAGVSHLDEPDLQVRASVSGKSPASADGSSPQVAVKNAEIVLQAHGDRLLAKLDGMPWEDGSFSTNTRDWKIELALEGDARRWHDRLRHWIEAPGWTIDGALQLDSVLSGTNGGIAFEGSTLKLRNLRALGPGWLIAEPQVDIEATGRWIPKSRQMEISDTTLVSTAVSLRGRDISWQREALPSGEVALRADASRVDSWRRPLDGKPPELRPSGIIVANLRSATQGKTVRWQSSAEWQEALLYKYQPPRQRQPAGYMPVGKQMDLTAQLTGDYQPDSDTLNLQEISLQGANLDASLAGRVQHLTGAPVALVQGRARYDLDDWRALFAALWGESLAMSGKNEARFELEIPLSDPTGGRSDSPTNAVWVNAQGKASAGWQRIDFFGLPIDKGRLEVALRAGQLNLTPISLSVGQSGRLSLAGTLGLTAPSFPLQLPPGPLLQDVHVTPEVNERLLKFIAPIAAKTTPFAGNEGRFSLQTEGGIIPLQALETVSLKGEFSIHELRAQPGPLGREILLVAEQISGLLKSGRPLDSILNPQQQWLLIEDEAVRFQIEGGRVYHDGLDLKVGDVEIRTRGSVGFDESLHLELEVPLAGTSLASSEWGRAISNAPLRITLGGTLSRPRADKQSLRELSRTLLRGAVDSGLRRALDQLLQPKD